MKLRQRKEYRHLNYIPERQPIPPEGNDWIAIVVILGVMICFGISFFYFIGSTQ